MAAGNSTQDGTKDGFAVAQRRRRIRNWALVAIVAVAGGVGYYINQRGNDAQTTQPLLATVARGNIENTVAAAGTLKPSSFVDVGAQVSGILQKLHVEVGDRVEQGQLLAEIDARVQEARVDASRANILAQEAQLEARKAALELARANAKRQERLMAENATSQLEYDNAINNLASAESSLIQLEKQIEQSRATLAQEETQLEFTKIYAPTSGTVVTIEMNEGRTLNATQMAPNILRIANLETMRVESDISEADVGNVRPGMPVYFKTLGGGERRWYGTVQQILPTPKINNNVVLYTGTFEVDNPDGMLLSEMTAQVYFVTSSAENVLTVPLGAVSFAGQEQASARFAAMQGGAGGPPNGPPPGGPGGPGTNNPAGSFPGGAGFQGGPPRGGPAAGAAMGRNADNRGGVVPRPALVTVVHDDGTQEERQVMVGLTSRVSAEIISGLREGEQVVAGIAQPDLPMQPQQPQQQNRGPNIRIGGGGFRGF